MSVELPIQHRMSFADEPNRLARARLRDCLPVVRSSWAPKAHQFGLGRMAAIYSDSYGMQVEIFTDLDEAICWLESTAAAGAAAAP